MRTISCCLAVLALSGVLAWPQTAHHTRVKLRAESALTGEPLIVYVNITCLKGELNPGEDRYEIEITVYDTDGKFIKSYSDEPSYCPSPLSESRRLGEWINVNVGLPIPDSPRAAPPDLAIRNPSEGRMYMANSTSAGGRSAIEVIDTRQGKFLAPIDIDDRLIAGVELSPDGRRLYALLYASSLGTPRPAYIAYIDTATNTIADRLELPGLLEPQTPALSPDGRYLYFAARTDSGSHRIRVVDLQQKSIAVLPDPIPSNADLRAVALTPDGAMLCAMGLGSLACYDTRSGTFIGRSAAAPPNRNMAPVFHPNGRWVYLLGRSFVNNELTIYVSVINTSTLTEYVRIPIVKPTPNDFRDSVARLRIDPTGERLILDERVNGVMNIIDTRTNRVVKTVEGLPRGGLGAVIGTQ